MGLLENRTIVIAGGSIGIGFAIAKRCVDEGAQVILGARTQADLERAVGELNKIAGEHRHYVVDVSQIDQVEKFAAFCEPFGVSGLVNSAGLLGPIGKTSEINLTLFAQTIQVNLLGTVNTCVSFSKVMKDGARKKIVNLSGGGAVAPFLNFSAYASSKAAIVRFSENFAREHIDEMDVNCIAPGFIKTRLHEETLKSGPDAAGKQFYERTMKEIESGGTSIEFTTDLAVFLLSDLSNGISGKLISAPFDAWKTPEFQERLRSDADLAALRRIDDKQYSKKA
jgi:NAD(P)-dependent dehydrogenase (short-subunit alcohol dehydrogenase family)